MGTEKIGSPDPRPIIPVYWFMTRIGPQDTGTGLDHRSIPLFFSVANHNLAEGLPLHSSRRPKFFQAGVHKYVQAHKRSPFIDFFHDLEELFFSPPEGKAAQAPGEGGRYGRGGSPRQRNHREPPRRFKRHWDPGEGALRLEDKTP